MKLLTVNDVSDILQLSRSKIYELAGSEIPVIKIGGAVRFSEDDLRRYLESCRQEGKAKPPPLRRPRLKHVKV